MKIADLNAPHNPSSGEHCATKQAMEALDSMVEKLKETVVQAAKDGDSFDAVERRVQQSVRELGFQTMDLLLHLQGDGDLGREIATTDGQRLQRSERLTNTTVRSIFGVHRFQQYTYAAGRKKEIALRPVSARLSLPKRQWSSLLQEISQTLVADSSYEQAMSNLELILGTSFSVDTAEKINGELGRAAGEFLGDLPKPPPESEAKFLVASADGKGVPLVKDDANKVTAFETGKKHPGNRRMATVASVYSVDPHVRTPEAITAALFREEPDEEALKEPRPRPQNKNTTAHFPEAVDAGDGNEFSISGIHVAIAWIIGQIHARRRKGQVLIALMDGQESLWDTMKLHLQFGRRTVPILDILHALAYVWEAAGLFEKQELRRKAFTRERCLRILRGDVRGVIRGLRRLGTIRKLSGKPADDLARICRYLEKNAERMRYDEYLRCGYPIASGVIEGACRHLVKDRMERSGMRWTLEGARSMLHVRAALQSDHWRTFLDNRIQIETERNHPHRDLLDGYQCLTVAC